MSKTDWRDGPRISIHDMTTANARAGVERMYPGELHGKPPPNSGKSSGARHEPLRFTFGKYRSQLVVDILEDDPGYVSWVARENIQGFRGKMEAAGIEVDE